MDEKKYRYGVGAMILNRNNLVFVGRRIDQIVESWQMPQGGLDGIEYTQDALLREIKEEIGTNNVEIIAEAKNWLYYDFPLNIAKHFWNGAYVGQQQKWFLVRFLGEDKEINVSLDNNQEFDSWKWVKKEELVDMVVDFKKDIYKKILLEFDSYFI